jgi:hypothetical protein
MAANILETFDRLGGLDWLVTWARANESTFVTAVLSRLFPAFPKDPGDGDGNTYNTQVNVGNMSDLDAARRISFLLSKAAHELENPTELIGEYAYEPERPYENPPEPEPRPDLIGDLEREPAEPTEQLYSIRKHSAPAAAPVQTRRR